MSLKWSVSPPHARAHQGLRASVFTQTAGAEEALPYTEFCVTVASTKLVSSIMSICTEVIAPYRYLLYALNRVISLATVLHMVTSSACTSFLLRASGTPPVGSTIIGSNFPVSLWIHVNLYFHNILWQEVPQAFYFSYDNLSFSVYFESRSWYLYQLS